MNVRPKRLQLSPVTYREACAYIDKYHRHHRPPQGHKFSIGVRGPRGALLGVACVGRPTARMLDDGYTAEVTRLCTRGAKNACSILYAACARAAKAMGYRRIITFILESETGVSLRAAGWACEGKAGGISWDRPSRSRKTPKEVAVMKQRWVKELS